MDPAAIAARLAKLKQDRAAKSASPTPHAAAAVPAAKDGASTPPAAGQLSGRSSPTPQAGAPAVPRVPDVPAVPTVPTIPGIPGLPSVPAVPVIPVVPDATPVAPAPAVVTFGMPAMVPGMPFHPGMMPAFGAPMAMMPVAAPITTTEVKPKEKSKEKQPLEKKTLRVAGDGSVWSDPSLSDWPDDDFRLWVGNLGNEVHTEHLQKSFAKYPSFLMAKVIRHPRTDKAKGFGFVSFQKPEDCLQALRDMNGKYIGNKPCVCKKSKWGERTVDDAKEATKQLIGQRQKQRKKYHTGIPDDGPPSASYKPY